VESAGGPVPRASGGPGKLDGLIGEAIADLLSVGVWEEEARRRVALAMERFKAVGKMPRSPFELLRMAGECL
jgi:hypothetical protein